MQSPTLLWPTTSGFRVARVPRELLGFLFAPVRLPGGRGIEFRGIAKNSGLEEKKMYRASQSFWINPSILVAKITYRLIIRS